MLAPPKLTSADLELLATDSTKRYELIEGELYVSKQPDWHHQLTCTNILGELRSWSLRSGSGLPNLAPGLIFAEDDDVAPDVVWISRARMATALQEDGKLHAAPELVVEVLSPGSQNERRDKDAKLKLYSRRGVEEYWIVDWRLQQVEVYRRVEAALSLAVTLHATDTLTSPLLPGFACQVAILFSD